MRELQKSSIDEFKAHFRGDVLLPGDAGYDEVRQIWNAMIDRKPALIARCTSPEDVVQAVKFARKHDLLVSIRGGGHNIAGNAVCDDGLMIDLSLMKRVQVDPNARRATVEPGCTLADFDAAAQAHGLATPLGINSTTGVAGLTLGGGFGWLSRKYGMTIDNLLSADVVTADGSQVRASETENADLFWGLRGGGGNFGIVTSFEFQLHPVGPNVLSGLIVFPFDQAKSVLTQFARFTETMPDELNVWMVTRKAPPLPFLPAERPRKGDRRARPVLCGRPRRGREADRAAARVRHGARRAHRRAAVHRLAAGLRSAPDARAHATTGSRTTSRELSDGAIDAIIEYAGKLPSPQCEIFIGTIGGQTTRVAPDAMAYSSRDANYVMNVHGRWESAAEDERCIAWAREFFAKSKPFASARRLHQLPHRGGDRPHRVRLRPDLQAAGGAEEEVRPDELLPDEPEHQAPVEANARRPAAPPRSRGLRPATWSPPAPGRVDMT